MFRRKKNYRFLKSNNRVDRKKYMLNRNTYDNALDMEIKEGDRGSKVLKIQSMLTGACELHSVIPAIIVDGEYGDETRNAVMKFQEFMGINVTGIVDKLTYSELEKEYNIYLKQSREENLDEYNINMNTKTGFYNEKYDSKIIAIGSSGNNVVELQILLNELSEKFPLIPKLTVDGKFGEKTDNSVRIFQGLFNLPTDGIVGKYTWTAIYDAKQGKIFPQSQEESDE